MHRLFPTGGFQITRFTTDPDGNYMGNGHSPGVIHYDGRTSTGYTGVTNLSWRRRYSTLTEPEINEEVDGQLTVPM